MRAPAAFPAVLAGVHGRGYLIERAEAHRLPKGFEDSPPPLTYTGVFEPDGSADLGPLIDHFGGPLGHKITFEGVVHRRNGSRQSCTCPGFSKEPPAPGRPLTLKPCEAPTFHV